MLEPELVEKLGYKAKDFKKTIFKSYKFEYDQDEGALGEDELEDFGFDDDFDMDDFGDEDFGGDDYSDDYSDDLDWRR